MQNMLVRAYARLAGKGAGQSDVGSLTGRGIVSQNVPRRVGGREGGREGGGGEMRIIATNGQFVGYLDPTSAAVPSAVTLTRPFFKIFKI